MAGTTQKFSSDGFDLDALQDAADNVVLELTNDGKGQKVVAPPPEPQPVKQQQQDIGTATGSTSSTSTVMDEAEDWKRRGNQAFGQGDFATAYDCYSSAIQATPGHPTGPELLELQEEWQKEQNAKARRRLQRQDEERRRKSKEQPSAANTSETAAPSKDDSSANQQSASEGGDEEQEEEEEEIFQPPRHEHNQKLAIYYNNRAASAMQMEQEQQAGNNTKDTTNTAAASNDNDDDRSDGGNTSGKLQDALQDCSIAVLLDASYGKAWLRRATIHERLQKTDLALSDAKKALELALASPGTAAATTNKIRQTVQRLQKLEDERLEKLKAETMDKLKDLGNSILGNFGLSLNNFSAQQDPNTGSYSISFNQNK